MNDPEGVRVRVHKGEPRVEVQLGTPESPGKWVVAARLRLGERIDTRPCWAVLVAVAIVVVVGVLAFTLVPVPHLAASRPIDTWKPPPWTRWLEPAVILAMLLCAAFQLLREGWGLAVEALPRRRRRS